MRAIDAVIVLIFMAILIWIGYLARKRATTFDDYILGGRRFSAFMLAATFMATMTGAGMTIGSSGQAYEVGAAMMWNYIGYGAGLIVFAFVAKQARKTGGRTMVEVISSNFGSVPRVSSAIVAILYTVTLVGYSIMAIGSIVTYTGIPISREIAIVVVTVIAIIYTSMGGLWAVGITDVVQFIIMVVAICVLAPLLSISAAGGYEAVTVVAASDGIELWNPVPGVTFSIALTWFLLVFLATPGDPTVPQRMLAGKDDKSTRNGMIIAGFFALLYGVALTVIGVSGRAIFPDLVAEFGTSEAILPVLFMRVFPPVLAGIALSGLVAAIVSTIDSMLLVASIGAVYDIGKVIFPKAEDDSFKKATRYAVVILGLIAMVIALYLQAVFGAMLFVFSLAGAALVAPFLATLYWKYATSWGISAGIICGAVVSLSMFFTGVYGIGGDPVYEGIIASILAIVIGSLIQRRTGNVKEYSKSP